MTRRPVARRPSPTSKRAHLAGGMRALWRARAELYALTLEPLPAMNAPERELYTTASTVVRHIELALSALERARFTTEDA